MTLIATIAGTLLGALVFLAGLHRERRIRVGFRGATRLGSLAQIALLTGGPRRAGETVVTALIEREQLRLDSTGRLYRTPLLPVDALGLAAVDLVGVPAPTFDDVIRRLRTADAMTELADDLVARGLVVDTARQRRTWSWVAAAQAVLVVAGVGLGAVSGSWFVAAAVVVVAVLGVVALARSSRAAQRTAAGDEAVRVAWNDRSLVTGAAGAVTIGGLAHHPDRAMRLVFSRGKRPRTLVDGYPGAGRRAGWVFIGSPTGGFWGGGGSGCSGGSSCGGGSGCGGGGSGCGGGSGSC
ncbi:TIGR04222 domain-containing membrane protein [Amycolatopsis rhabdoformis]|uniref:TIGR04222 domain-containing membrane protein n=1 Tax=Amycolatopsis rhabdoformis TaxID=1448059 RepID=A0ABZ1I988_9PSEU|nr:TIGR04222 domain-containing membrane protein [Amycolatopsis rhabdoformis]WSE31019.1 TIGR04222 domain-containing membrane protein [Amycolatopsis rhabdoformis]